MSKYLSAAIILIISCILSLIIFPLVMAFSFMVGYGAGNTGLAIFWIINILLFNPVSLFVCLRSLQTKSKHSNLAAIPIIFAIVLLFPLILYSLVVGGVDGNLVGLSIVALVTLMFSLTFLGKSTVTKRSPSSRKGSR